MEKVRDFINNDVLMIALVSWLTAQLLKLIFACIQTKSLALDRFVGAGGMPSAHSATVCSLTVAIGRLEGLSSPIFAIAFVFACIVMYDAMGVRRAAGEQAKVINFFVAKHNKEEEVVAKHNKLKKEDNTKIIKKEMKEFIGHTPLEVVGGIIVGVVIALIFPIK